MRTHAPSSGAAFAIDEEFRQRVVRQAILLGFSCHTYDEEVIVNRHVSPVQFRTATLYAFWYEDIERRGYMALYKAALEYMRLIGFPLDRVGVVNDG